MTPEKCTKKDHSVTTSPPGPLIGSRHTNQPIYPPMDDKNPITLLILRRLPARVDYQGAAYLLNFGVVVCWSNFTKDSGRKRSSSSPKLPLRERRKAASLRLWRSIIGSYAHYALNYCIK
jgi:hypothetical protein